MKQRTFRPCRRCGKEHSNQRSSSLCTVCGPLEAEENKVRAEELLQRRETTGWYSFESFEQDNPTQREQIHALWEMILKRDL